MASAPSYTAYQVIAAWVIMILLLMLIAKSTIGKTLIYYMLVMAILVFVLAEYQSLTSLLAPFTHPGGNANG